MAEASQNNGLPLPAEPLHLLIVDTDPGLRWALDKGLQLSGYRVSTASTLDKWMAESSSDSPDCIIIELLPESGLTLDTLSTAIGLPGAPPP